MTRNHPLSSMEIMLIWINVIIWCCVGGVALADASIDLGGKRTRMDEARDWCLEKGDPSLNYYIIDDGTRVVFAAGCAQFLDEAPAEYCYKPYGQPVVAEHYVDHAIVHVNWLLDGTGEGAWSEWSVDEEQSLATCEVWVQRPKQPLGDPDMDALGHEVLHCLIGDFHP